MNCDVCGKYFRSLYYVARHKRQVHKILSGPLKHGPYSVGKYICDYCNGNWTRRTNLKKHLILVHGQSADVPTETSMTCPYDFCGKIFSSTGRTLADDVRNHILKEHSVSDVAYVKKQFVNVDEFKDWKLNEERTEKVKFIQTRGTAKGSSKLVSHFYCNKSENPRRRKKELLKVDVQELLKIGKFCPAKITSYTDINTGEVVVKYFNIHVGHKDDINISHANKNKIAISKITKKINQHKLIVEENLPCTNELIVDLINNPRSVSSENFKINKNVDNILISDSNQELSENMDGCIFEMVFQDVGYHVQR